MSNKQEPTPIQILDRALLTRPYDAGIWLVRGMRKSDVEDYKGAIKDFDRAIELKSDDARGWISRGIVRLRLKKPTEALDDFHEAQGLKPEDAEAWALAGLAETHRQRYQEAIENYDKAIELSSDYALAWLLRGVARARWAHDGGHSDKGKPRSDFERARTLAEKQGDRKMQARAEKWLEWLSLSAATPRKRKKAPSRQAARETA